MRQLVCMSADVYCQITNNFYLRNNIILYLNGKKGKRASCRRDRERVCERQRVAENGVGIHCKTAVWRRINYFGISREPNVRIAISWETILVRKGDQQRYIKITQIEIIFADAWWHLVTTTFHLHFQYLFTTLFQPEAAAPAARPLAASPSLRASPALHSSALQGQMS